jgi:DNA-directed RNA polymerase subunit RPC12/RpoP
MVEGRCMHCKKQVEIKDVEFGINARGINIAKGVCPICNTKVYRILPKDKGVKN